MTVGNHELYINNTAAREYTSLVPLYENSYLASNLNITDPKTGISAPFALRSKKFRTPNQNLTILAFGFLYNFHRYVSNVQLQPVSATVQERWFQDALKDPDIDLILVAGHVHLQNNTQWAGTEFPLILNATHKLKPKARVLCFGGHSHVRDFKVYGERAFGIQSGRYMETVGFMSISGLVPSRPPSANPICKRRYIDNNLFSFYNHTTTTATTFDTPLGLAVSKNIAAARSALQLDKRYGCALQNLSLYGAPYPSNGSILTWLEEQALPDTFTPLLSRSDACNVTTNNPMLVMTNSGAIRFDIFAGYYTVDSNINMSPFSSGFRCLTNVPYDKASNLVAMLNAGPPIIIDELDPPGHVPLAASDHSRKLDFQAAASEQEQMPLRDAAPTQPPLIPGYVTKDDLGSDGDDTIHSPYPTFVAPNVIGATVGYRAPAPPPNIIDILYNEFMQKPVLDAMTKMGAAYTPDNTRTALGGKTLTSVVSEWVQKDWICPKEGQDGVWKDDL